MKYILPISTEKICELLRKAYDQYLQIKTERIDNETFYRLSVPNRLLREMYEGKKFPFTFTVNEHNGNTFIGWQEWTPGICGGKNKGAWGELQIVE